jgi:DNA (cytosine-5)-methyltransferase 1
VGVDGADAKTSATAVTWALAMAETLAVAGALGSAAMRNAYYNDNDAFACAWLRELIKAGLLPDGEVDERSILDVDPADLRPFRQCHFFTGIGGWPRALGLAGWDEEREIWTGSAPCQPLSVAGLGRGHADERHVWPAFYRLVAKRRPATMFGEQVASKDGREWLAGVRADLEGAGYACGAAIMPACAVGAPHRRERLFWVAQSGAAGQRDNGRALGDEGRLAVDAGAAGLRRRYGSTVRGGAGAGGAGLVADAAGERQCPDEPRPDREDGQFMDRTGARRNSGDNGATGLAADAGQGGRAVEPPQGLGLGGFWSDAVWLAGADGKTRRVKSGVRLLVDGVPNRVGRLRGYGNAIVPQIAAEFVRAFAECRPKAGQETGV